MWFRERNAFQSITAGGAVDDYNYLFVVNPDGEQENSHLIFLPLRKAIYATSVLNMVIRNNGH